MATTNLNNKIFRNTIGDVYNRSGHPFDQCPIGALDQISSLSGYHYYADDFHTYTGGASATGDTVTGGWLLADTNASAITCEADAQFGKLKLTTAGAENDSAFLQLAGAQWKYVVGKRLWCFAKFNISDANDMDVFFGLVSGVTTEAAFDTIGEILALDDGIYFEKAETATQFDFHTRKNDVSTEDTLVTTAFDDGVTDRIIGFSVSTAGVISAWDGTTMDNLTEVATRAAGVATIPNDVALSLTFGFENGAGADAEDMTIDWVLVAQER